MSKASIWVVGYSVTTFHKHRLCRPNRGTVCCLHGYSSTICFVSACI